METNKIKEQKVEEAEIVKKQRAKATGWDNILIQKQVSIGVKKKMIAEDTTEDDSEVITRNVMETALFEYFYQKISSSITTKIEVTTKVFRRKIGFGFITEDERFFKSKAVRLERSSFFNTNQQSLVRDLSEYSVYSEVYNIWQTRRTKQTGKTFFILRHFLHWSNMMESQRRSLMIATTKTVAGAVAVVFADPVFVDEEFVVVEVDETDGCWFMVVSTNRGLPLRMNTMFLDNQSSLTCSMSLKGLSLFQKLIIGSFSVSHA